MHIALHGRNHMLDFKPSDLDSEKRNRSTQIRHGDMLARLIEEASVALAVDKSVFLRAAILKEAERVLRDRSHHQLTGEDIELFQKALDTPPPPTEAALAAAKAYRARVVHAD